MLKHIVMWKLKEENKSGNIQIMAEKLRGLKQKIACIKDLQVGINNEKDKDETDFDIILVSSFMDKIDLEKYLQDAEHEKVARFIRAVAGKRAVVDYEI